MKETIHVIMKCIKPAMVLISYTAYGQNMRYPNIQFSINTINLYHVNKKDNLVIFSFIANPLYVTIISKKQG